MLARERLIQCLDVTVFVHLLAVYTLDDTLWRVVIGALAHLDVLRPLDSQNRTGVMPLIAVLSTQVCAILTHIYGQIAQETVDGYLHGTILSNFIGVAPSSRARLIGLDLVVIFAELCIFAAARDPRRGQAVSLDILDPSEDLAAIHRLVKDDLDLAAFTTITRQLQDPEPQPDP